MAMDGALLIMVTEIIGGTTPTIIHGGIPIMATVTMVIIITVTLQLEDPIRRYALIETGSTHV